METIILDTDFETDCDDAGALVVLHALANRGEAEILGVVASIHSPWPAAGVRAMNLAAGRPEVPVGSNFDYPNTPRYRAHCDKMKERLYHEAIVRRYPEAAPGRFQPEEGVALYRRLLAAAPDRSVTICAIGLLTLLAALLRREPELVARKVKRLATMAEAVFPEGRPGFNWEMDPEAAEFLVAHWPSPLLVSPVGGNVLTGTELAAAVGPENPERIAYRCFGSGAPGFLRPSWDQLAVLTAAGLADREGYTGRSGRGRVTFDAAANRHRWFPAEDGPHECLSLLRPPAETAAWVEGFMIEPWQNQPIPENR